MSGSYSSASYEYGCWEWDRDDGGGFCPYTPQESYSIERAYLAGAKTHVHGVVYFIDFDIMTMTHLTIGKRSVQRVGVVLTPTPEITAYWVWSYCPGKFLPYDTEASVDIELAYLDLQTTVDLSKCYCNFPYTIDFSAMKQISHQFTTQRDIQRVSLDPGISLQSLLRIPAPGTGGATTLSSSKPAASAANFGPMTYSHTTSGATPTSGGVSQLGHTVTSDSKRSHSTSHSDRTSSHRHHSTSYAGHTSSHTASNSGHTSSRTVSNSGHTSSASHAASNSGHTSRTASNSGHTSSHTASNSGHTPSRAASYSGHTSYRSVVKSATKVVSSNISIRQTPLSGVQPSAVPASSRAISTSTKSQAQPVTVAFPTASSNGTQIVQSKTQHVCQTEEDESDDVKILASYDSMDDILSRFSNISEVPLDEATSIPMTNSSLAMLAKSKFCKLGEAVKGAVRTVSSKLKYPIAWKAHSNSEDYLIVPLAKDCHEYCRVEAKFKESLLHFPIIAIKRVQNKVLWDRYNLAKDQLRTKNAGVVNEMELFHGSRTTPSDDICGSEEGFDMRFSRKGLWGQANYFAVKAYYSHHYAYSLNDDQNTKELILAKVLTGDSFESEPDSTLRFPPEKKMRSGHLKQVRYDTVHGHTEGYEVYMTYSNEKAYPAYVIVYTGCLLPNCP